MSPAADFFNPCRCFANRSNLDDPTNNTHWRSHEKTDFLITNFDPSILWDEYEIRQTITVRLVLSVHGDQVAQLNVTLAAFYTQLSTRLDMSALADHPDPYPRVFLALNSALGSSRVCSHGYSHPQIGYSQVYTTTRHITTTTSAPPPA